MNYLKTSVGIFIALAVSRFIPHPPNFTSLIALAFYVPFIFGVRFIPALIFSFILTDFFIGFHSTIVFTWGSLIIIGYITKYFLSNMITRISGSLFGALLFYIITNFGVWTTGVYGFEFSGLVASYTLAIPFFTYTIISTLIFSSVIEFFIYLKNYLLIKFR